MTTPIQLHRIKILIEELTKLRQRAIDKSRGIEFDMTTWMDPELCSPNLGTKINKAVKNPCGTSACLAGKAGLIPKIRKLGFQWDITPKSYGTSAGFSYTENEFRYTGNSAVSLFFGGGVFKAVFLDVKGINTLHQGIMALKRFVHKARKEAA